MANESLHVDAETGRVFVRSEQGLTTVEGGRRILYWPTTLRVARDDAAAFHCLHVDPLRDGEYWMGDGTRRIIRCKDGGATVAERWEDVVIPRPKVRGKTAETRWNSVGAGRWEKRSASTKWMWVTA